MDMIINIFKSLGVDESILPQFITVIVLFFLLKTILFSRLQEILELRESKTTKLDGGADGKFLEAENLSKQYSEAIQKAQEEAHQELANTKKVIDTRESEIKATSDAQVEKEVELKRGEFTVELQAKKEEILKEASDLSKEFVTKLTH